jgi:hypothetical protein
MRESNNKQRKSLHTSIRQAMDYGKRSGEEKTAKKIFDAEMRGFFL